MDKRSEQIGKVGPEGEPASDPGKAKSNRRTVLQLVAAGLLAPGAASTVSAEADAVVDILSVDPSDFPNVLLNINVDTPAGRDGSLTEADFEIIEDGIRKEISSFSFGGTKSDIVFVFDDTGSMGDQIDGMKAEVTDLVSEIETAGIDSRYGLVTFKDDVSVELELTDDASALKDEVDTLFASGGGDLPEANFDAIQRALEFDFRSDAQKVVIDITDAVSHYRGDGSGVSEYTLDEMADSLSDSGVAYVAVAPDIDDENASKKDLASAVDGRWIDIDDADFITILEQITELVVTAYVVEYVTDLLPGAVAPISIVVDDPDRGTTEADGHIDVPSDVSDGGLAELIDEKRELIDSIRETARPVLTDELGSSVPDSIDVRIEADDLDSEAERYLDDLDDRRSEFDDELVAQHEEAVERLLAIEEVTNAAADAPITDPSGGGSVIERQVQASMDIAKTLAFEAVASGAGKVAKSSLVRGIADDIVRSTLREVDSIKRGFSTSGYGGGGSAARDQRLTFSELDDELKDEVLARQVEEDKEFIEGGSSALIGGSLGLADDMVDTFDRTVDDATDAIVRLEYEKYLNGGTIPAVAGTLDAFAEFDPPTLDLSAVPDSVNVPLSDTANDLVDGAEDATNGFLDFIDETTDAVEGVDYLENLDYDRSGAVELSEIPDEIELPLLSDLPDEIDLGDVSAVDDVQQLAAIAAELVADSNTAIDPTVDRLVRRLESDADDGLLEAQPREARVQLLELVDEVISAIVDGVHSLFDNLATLSKHIDLLEQATGVLVLLGALIGLISTGGPGAVVALGVFSALSLIAVALSVVVDSATFLVGEQTRETVSAIHNAAGGALAADDLAGADGGA